MDPVTARMTASIVASLAKSKSGWRFVGAVVAIWTMVAAAVVILPGYLSAGNRGLYRAISCAAVVPGGDGAPRPVGNAAAPLAVNVATWNALYTLSTSQVVTGLQQIAASGADVIGAQELSPASRRTTVRTAMAASGFAMSAGNNAVPIFYRASRYDLMAQGHEEVFGVVRVEAGASGASIGPKNIEWVQLRDRRTGGVFFQVNHHLLPSIETRGRPDRRSPLRLGLAERQITAVGALAGRLTAIAPVLVSGDWNIDARKDSRVKAAVFPQAALGRRGLQSNWRVLGYPKRGTHGRDRLVDYVMSTTSTLAPVKQRILGKFGSDHSAVLVTATSTSVRRAPTPPAVSAAVTPPQPATGSVRQQQIANARLIERGVLEVGGSGRAVYLALVAAVGESDLINVNHGDTAGPDSRGLFQQRANWASLAERMNPTTAAKLFMLGPHQGRQGGLLDLPNWAQLRVTTAIHRVQVNADPEHYSRFEARARSIGEQAGVNFDAPPGSVPGPSSTDSALGGNCDPAADPALAAMPGIGTGSCPLDPLYAPGRKNPRGCNGALAFMQQQMATGSNDWYRRCMALVAQAYGWQSSGNATAFIGAQRVIAAGKMRTDRSNIPAGAVLWWDGRSTGNSAGHVAIYDGQGYILSNDVTGAGQVGRVPWDFPETNWHQKWLGWSPPHFPNAVGG